MTFPNLDLVILGAGRGRRLFGEDEAAKPKPLIEINGMTIMDRWLGALSPFFNVAVVVVGFKKEIFRERRRVIYATNEKWEETNTAASLAVGLRSRFHCPGDVLLINGDVVASDLAIRAVITALRGLDRTTFFSVPEANDESVKVSFDNDRVLAIGKNLRVESPSGDWEAVGVNFLTADDCRRYCHHYTVNHARQYYEDVFDDMIRLGRMQAGISVLSSDDITEIDTTDDLEKARRILRA